jgi:hypothetical protein
MGMVLDSANDWKSIHAELDLNGDGRLDLAELTAFMKALVVKPRVKTGNATLSVTEFSPRVGTFYPRRGDWKEDRGQRTLQKLRSSKLIDSAVVYQECAGGEFAGWDKWR